jgi:hypothetical protein
MVVAEESSVHPIRLAVLSCLFVAPLAEARAEDEPYLTRARVVEPSGLIRKKLEAPAHFEFVDTPLRDVAQAIQDQYDFSIVFDARAFEEEGIPYDEPVNLSFEGITLRSALKILLEPLGLTTTIGDEVLIVTSWKRGEDQRSTRFYEVQHLLDAGLSNEQLVEAVEHVATHGRVTPLNNLLLVTDSGHNHAEVERLLDLLSLKLKPVAED